MRLIICGVGQVGFYLAKYLSEQGNDVTVIDQSQELINLVNDKLEVNGICGQGSHPDVLQKAGIEDAEMVIAVTGSDEVNMIACEVAHSLFGVPKKIARIRSQAYLQPQWHHLFKTHHISIDYVISPEIEVAKSIIRSLSIPGSFDVIPLAEGRVKIVAIQFIQGNPLLNTPIRHMRSVLKNVDMIPLVCKREEHSFLPQEDDIFEEGDQVYFAMNAQEIHHAMEQMGFEQKDHSRMLIIGGGNIGFCLAQEAERTLPNIRIHLIEKHKERATEISRSLEKTMVLHGDALDSEILMEGSVHKADTVVAVTEDDRVNTLVCALSKSLGTYRALCLCSKKSFSNLATSLGIDGVISPRGITVSKILQHIRKGRIRAVHSLGENIGEIIEGEVLESSNLAGKTVEEISKPQRIIVAAILRQDQTIIPTPQITFLLDDRVIFMVSQEGLHDVEKLLMARFDMGWSL
jgi:trk system potassium uptake protein TrkA